MKSHYWFCLHDPSIEYFFEKSTPKNLKWVTVSILVLSNVMISEVVEDFCFCTIITYFVFAVSCASSFDFKESNRLLSHAFDKFTMSSKWFLEKYVLVSSMYRNVSDVRDLFKISSMYIMKDMAPRIDPWTVRKDAADRKRNVRKQPGVLSGRRKMQHARRVFLTEVGGSQRCPASFSLERTPYYVDQVFRDQSVPTEVCPLV